ncbi:flagellar basal body L-ring protein FlgH [Undibacterium sp. TJN19]|uniref:flagellar basal body L-ring protein FlgH n=1 Tax=Undibacterium sp. TJN19 TaxID=3413055 RepID=UPI003BF339E0
MKSICTTLMLLLAVFSAPARSDNLYNENTYRSLASDKRARLPGDVLTVLIYENSSASTSADTNLKKKNDIGAQVSVNQNNHQAHVGLSNDFDGGGSVQRTGKLLAQMTVTVTKIEENGDLWVKGQQLLEINSDQQKIAVEGRVRPLDISDSNTILSYRLADAKISYLGDGDLASRQRPGIWSRLFVWAGF